jgi:hypothetical protein
MTLQVRDVLIYNEEKLGIASEPLYEYLQKAKLPHKLVAPHSACWRGYVAIWTIDNKKLFLIGWQGNILDDIKVGIDYLFPDEEFVFAKWFTGKIRIEMGEFVGGGYSSIHEGERFLVFENGVLIDEYVKWLTKEEIEKIQNEEKDFPF